MKYLILMRHGRAGPAPDSQPDRDRPLTPGGVEEVKSVVSRLCEKRIIIQRLVSSPALRARQTARSLSQASSIPENDIVFEPRLYEQADAPSFLKIIAAQEDRFSHVAFVGHNPVIERVVAILCADFKGKIPAGAMIVLTLPIFSWKETAPGVGKITLTITP